MGAQLENYFSNEYLKKIEALAALSLYGQNVKIATHRVVKDICDSAKKFQQSDIVFADIKRPIDYRSQAHTSQHVGLQINLGIRSFADCHS